jgi:hypothetical protein
MSGGRRASKAASMLDGCSSRGTKVISTCLPVSCSKAATTSLSASFSSAWCALCHHTTRSAAFAPERRQGDRYGKNDGSSAHGGASPRGVASMAAYLAAATVSHDLPPAAGALANRADRWPGSLATSALPARTPAGMAHAFSSRLISLRKRQSVPSAMILLGVELSMPNSCSQRA